MSDTTSFLTLDMFDFSKSVDFTFEKKHLDDLKCQVTFIADVSGSMIPLYNNGLMQKIYEALLPIAWRVDEDQKVDSIVFDDNAYRLPDVTLNNASSYVEDEITSDTRFWRGTRYSEALNLLSSKIEERNGLLNSLVNSFKTIFGKRVEIPSKNELQFVLFLTDGENFDKKETLVALQELKQFNIFVQFIGIGDEKFKYLQSLDNQFNYVGFQHVNDLSVLSVDELYDRIISDEFVTWYKGKNND